MKTGQEKVYQLVTEGEANILEGKIATTTPIAKGLMGKKVGDTAEVVVPAGKMTFKNLEVSKPSDDKLELRMVSDKSYTSNYGPTKLVATLEFNTPDSVLPMDTLFMFADSDSLHTFSVGQFDLATQTFSGSRIQYHLAKDMDFITNSWRIKSGKMKIDGNGGFTVSGKLYMGSNFNIVCTMPAPTPVENVVFDKAHVEKLMRDGKIVISIDGVEYDVQGRVIQ
jgi:hypothetical protein